MKLRPAPTLLALTALSTALCATSAPVRHAGHTIAVIRVTRPNQLRGPSVLPPMPEASGNTRSVLRAGPTMREGQPLQQPAPRVIKPLRPLFPWWFRRRHLAAPQFTIA